MFVAFAAAPHSAHWANVSSCDRSAPVPFRAARWPTVHAVTLYQRGCFCCPPSARRYLKLPALCVWRPYATLSSTKGQQGLLVRRVPRTTLSSAHAAPSTELKLAKFTSMKWMNGKGTRGLSSPGLASHTEPRGKEAGRRGEKPFPPRETKEARLGWSRLEKEVAGGVPATPRDKEWTGRGAGSRCEGFARRTGTRAASRRERSPGREDMR